MGVFVEGIVYENNIINYEESGIMQMLKQKKYRTLKRQTCFIVFISSVLFFLVCSDTAFTGAGFLERNQDYNPVDASLVPDLLTDLTAVTKENYDKIQTWQGTREHVSIRIYRGDAVNVELQNAELEISDIPKTLETIAEGTTQFKVNSKHNTIWSQMNFPQGRTYKNTETMEVCGTVGAAVASTIIARPDFTIRTRPSLFEKDGTLIANKAFKFDTQDPEEVGGVVKELLEA